MSPTIHSSSEGSVLRSRGAAMRVRIPLDVAVSILERPVLTKTRQIGDGHAGISPHIGASLYCESASESSGSGARVMNPAFETCGGMTDVIV